MKKQNIIAASVVLVVLLGLFYYQQITETKSREQEKEIVESEENVVFNHTNVYYYDDIILAGLDELGIKNVGVTVEKLSEGAKENFRKQGGGELSAHIKEFLGKYYLFIESESKEEAVDIIAHELIHLYQYETKKLILSNDTMIWEGKGYHRTQLSYDDRPWEIEADEQESELAQKIKNKLSI